MKHMKKLLALLLVLSLTLALALPAAAEAKPANPLIQVMKQMAGQKGMGYAYVYPYANVFDASVVKGSSITLSFKKNMSSPGGNSDQFYVAIFRGSLADLDENSKLVEERTYSMSKFNNSISSLGMTWTADSRYSVGTYCILCFVLDSDGYMYDQDYYASDLYVTSGNVSAKELELYTVDDGNFDDSVPKTVAYSETWLTPVPYPYNTTTPRTAKVYVTEPSILNARVENGYVVLLPTGYGKCTVTVTCAGVSYVLQDLIVGGSLSYGLKQGKANLCVGMTDQLTTTGNGLSGKTIVSRWRSSNPAVVTVDNNGKVTAVGAGTAQVGLEIGSNYAYVTYTVQKHELPEDAPYREKTATKPGGYVGYCPLCGDEDAIEIVEPAIFSDTLPNSWYSDAVDTMYESELMNGVSKDRFNPQGAVTRAQLVTILYRMAGEPEVEYTGRFKDVPAGKWYSNAVEWAAQEGIVTGKTADVFGTNDPITREQIAVILYRTCGSPEVEGNLNAFPDGNQTSKYAVKGMVWAINQGLITGIKSGTTTTLSPKSGATRAQIAVIVVRFFENVIEDAEG